MRRRVVYDIREGIAKRKKLFTKVFAPTFVISLIFAGIVGLSSVFATTAVDWDGQQGTTNGALNTSLCDDQNTGYILWVFSLGGGTETVTSATLHLGGSGSGDYAMSKTGHEMKATTPYFNLSTLTASADYTGTLGTGNTNLTMSHGCVGGVVLRDVTTHLTLVKHVVNNHGGNADASDWTLAASDDNGVVFSGNGTADADVTPTVEYTLSESGGPAGYVQDGDWVCDGGTFVPPDKITLAEGDDVTCTVTNKDTDPTLTLVKVIVNDNGGKAFATDWTLSADGQTPISGKTGDTSITSADVVAGTYTLSESGGPSGYTASDWSCVKNNDAPVSGASITLGLGDAATCTITNDDDRTAVLGCTTDEVGCDEGGTDNTGDQKDTPSDPVVLAASTELTNTGTPISGASLAAAGLLSMTTLFLGYGYLSRKKS